MIRIKKFFRKLKMMMSYKAIRAMVTFYYAKSKARKFYESTGNRYYVLCDNDGKLVIVDRPSFYRLKRKKKIGDAIQPNKLQMNSMYYTKGWFSGYSKGRFCEHPLAEMSRHLQKIKLDMYIKMVLAM